jgi:hypothetical protein
MKKSRTAGSGPLERMSDRELSLPSPNARRLQRVPIKATFRQTMIIDTPVVLPEQS